MGDEKIYLVKDLVDFEVLEKTGEVLGQLKDVLPTGSNDVFVVKKGEAELLIPALKSVVVDIDPIKKQITVELPRGLREI